MPMFEKAVREKIRWNYKGCLSVEDLWDLRLKDLDEIFKDLNRKAKTSQEESLLGTKSQADELLATQIEIVKHIASVKLAEKSAAETAATKASLKRKLLELREKKQDASLEGKSMEELDKMIAEL